MAIPSIKTSLSTGELAPSLAGHTDLARFGSASFTQRNFYVGYRGGAYSRAGTSFVGYSIQTGRAFPPRLIPFQFSINDGLILEFGNFCMRVIYRGALVTDVSANITAATQANPVNVTASGTIFSGATVNNGATSLTYKPGDQITLAGGTRITPGVLLVASTALLSIQSNLAGTGYAPADIVRLAGGVQNSPVNISITSTRVAAAGVAAAGTGGTPGSQIVTGTTGTGTKFQASVAVGLGGAIAFVNSVTLPGNYTVNPTTPASELVTGGGLTGARLSLSMAPNAISVSTPGSFSTNPTSGNMTQLSTTGGGTGATFSNALLGPLDLTVANTGDYTVYPPNPVAQASTTGTGLGATFNLSFSPTPAISNGDWVFISGVAGMTQLNGRTFVAMNVSGSSFDLYNVFGVSIDGTGYGAYTGSGFASRIFKFTMPYAEADLAYVKFTQSADVMSLCCLNQLTGVEYPPIDLSRISNAQFTLSPVVAVPSVLPPTSVTSDCPTLPPTGPGTYYQYVVTSVSPDDASESVASSIGYVDAKANNTTTAATVTTTWAPVQGVAEYNIYKAPLSFNVRAPAGCLFGYCGSAFGTQFIDSNITADFTQVPPLHKDPFARGQLIGAFPTAIGTGYTVAVVTVNTSTGSGARITPIIQSTTIVGYILVDAGKDYGPNDTITVTGDGTGATASLRIGAQAGTYPSVVAYFQQRRAYAATRNNPDTYYMSQPGAFRNFDVRAPTIDSDAITGTPWAVQVNGIQFMLAMPGGLIAFTGLSAWQLTGPGGSSFTPQPITPGGQNAQPQSYTGCSATVPPIKIGSEILYVQAKGSVYYDITYQYANNIYTGSDITESSAHLFTNYTTVEHAWCEEPYKVLWSVRSDGILRSLTFLKVQQIVGWARHDTQGLYKSVATITEPPTDALYLATQRVLGGNTSYMLERMDDRLWAAVEDSWCVDVGLSLFQPEPNATLTADLPYGLGAITGATGLIGGTGYSAATIAAVVDNNGKAGGGTGAVPTLTIVAGVITAVTFAGGSQGTGYTFPALVITDPTNEGGGASAVLTLDTTATFTASAAVFSSGNVGDVIRMGGGIATITTFTDSTHVKARVTVPITQLIPDMATGTVQPQTSGNWTMTTPVTTLRGYDHLAGASGVGLADGKPFGPVTIPSSGVLTLPFAASSIVFGLGYQCQLQSTYLNEGEPTMQGQRKKIAAVTARVEQTRGMFAGQNQQNGSMMSPPQIAPTWYDLDAVPELARIPYNSDVRPLYTGDVRLPLKGGFDKPGEVCIQQDLPLPATLLAWIPEVLTGDSPDNDVRPPKDRAR